MANRLFTVLFWLGVALVLAAAVDKWFGNATQAQFIFPLFGAGLACMLGSVIGGAFSQGGRSAYSANTALSVVVMLALLGVVNYIGKRQNKRWDVTAAKQFSLSDQSRTIVSKIDAPLQIRVFDRDFRAIREQLSLYEDASNNVKVEYVDADKQRAVAEAAGIRQYGTLVFNYKDRTTQITESTERDITNAIIKVVGGQARKLYFTTGHGERDSTSQEPNGYGVIASAVAQENYTVDRTVLAQTGAVPDDANAIVIAGPRQDFLPAEVEALKKYLAKDGKVLMLLDPQVPLDNPPLTNLIGLAHEWGIDVGPGIVVDQRSVQGDITAPVAMNYPAHPITDHANLLTLFPMSRPVTPVQGGVDGHTAQTIVETSSASWNEVDTKTLVADGRVALDEDKGDKKGPISIAAAVAVVSTEPAKPDAAPTDQKPEARLVVFGGSNFGSNGTLGFGGNRDMFMNTLSWLTQQENLIAIRPRQPDDRRISLTDNQMIGIFILVMVGVPALVLGTGVYTWYRRR